MASFYSELYSDFKDQTKNYVEKLDITPASFMRYFSRAMQQFQRDTEYKEINVILTAVNGVFTMPTDLIRIIEVKDADGFLMLQQDPDQFSRYMEEEPAHRTDGYSDYIRRLDASRGNLPNLYTIWGRVFNFYPAYTKTTIKVRYIPEISAFSAASSQWALWFTNEDAFETQFTTTGVPVEFNSFEQSFLNYTIGQYIKTQGNRNYQVFESMYKTDVKLAKDIKPVYFKQGVRPAKWI